MLAFCGKVLFVRSQVRKQFLRERKLASWIIWQLADAFRRIFIKNVKKLACGSYKPLAQAKTSLPSLRFQRNTCTNNWKLCKFTCKIRVICDVKRASSSRRMSLPREASPVRCKSARRQLDTKHTLWGCLGRAVNVRLAGLFSKLAEINFSLCWNFVFVGPGAVRRWRAEKALKASVKFIQMPLASDRIYIFARLVWIPLPQHLKKIADKECSKVGGGIDFRRPLSCHLKLDSRAVLRWHLQTPSSVT